MRDTPYDHMCKLARRCKRTGITKEEFTELAQASIHKAAAEQGDWRPAELAISLADVTLAAEHIYNTT